jgi:hypothetical protein
MMLGSEDDAVTNLTDRLINETESALAVTARIGRRQFQLVMRILQQAQRSVHVRLLGQSVSNSHAGRDGQRQEQSLARYEPKHNVLHYM